MGSNHGEDEINFSEKMEQFVERADAEKGLSQKAEELEKEEELEKSKNLSQKFAEIDKLRTGQPDGKLPPIRLTPQDQGDIRFSVGVSMDKKRVVINFGKQIRWVGMNRNQAIEVGRALIKSAKETVI